MKRIVSIMIALLAIIAGASADDRTKITKIEGTSNNFDAIPRLGNRITQPTIIVTEGAPAYFEKNGHWEKKVDGQWQDVTSGTFTEGTWRLFTFVKKDPTTDPDNEFVLDNNVQITVNGIRWGCPGPVFDDDNRSWGGCYSPTITLSRSKVSLVESTSKNLDAIPQLGNPIAQPTFIVTKGAPAFFDNHGRWEKWVDGDWEPVYSGTITEGSWHYFDYVEINSTTDPNNEYVLDKSLIIKVNGIKWGHYTSIIYDNKSIVGVYSPTFIVDSRTKITKVEGKGTDLTTIPVYGEPVTKMPSFSVTKGAPAYFYTKHLSGAVWQKKVDDSWQNVTSA